MTGDPILGNKLRRGRRELQLTQAEVAAAIGVSRSHLTNVENGKRGLGSAPLTKAAKRLGLSLDFLAAAEGEDPAGAAYARTQSEAVLLALSRTLPEKELDALLAFLNSLSSASRKRN